MAELLLYIICRIKIRLHDIYCCSMNFQMKMSAIGVGPTVFHIVETIQEILIFMEKLDFSLAE